MDTTGWVHDVAVAAATRGDDLGDALPRLLRVTRYPTDLRAAVTLCDVALAERPDDDAERRAREILVGALSTTAYRSATRDL